MALRKSEERATEGRMIGDPFSHIDIESTHICKILIDSSPAYFILIDREMNLSYANYSFLAGVGYFSDEVLEKNFVDMFVFDDDRDNIKKSLDRIINNPNNYEGESRILKKDGDVLYIQWQGTPIIGKSGQVEYILGVGIDLTEKKRTEMELEMQKAYMEELFEGSPEAIVVLNTDDRVIKINKGFTHLFGYTQEESEGEKINDLIVPDDLKGEGLQNTKKVAKGQSIYGDTVRSTKDGKRIDVSLIGTPIKLGEDQIGVYGIYRDITVRKGFERALKESEKKYRNIYELAPVGIYRTTPDGKILMANPYLIELLGYDSLEDLKERDIEKDGYLIENERSRFVELMEECGEVENFETIWKRKNGSPIYVSENSIAIKDDDGSTMFYEGTIEDITRRMIAQMELEKQKAYFEELFEGSPEPILVVDPDDRVQLMNNAFTELFGFDQKDMEDKKLSDLIIPKGLEQESIDFNERVSNGETICEITKRLSRSGELIDVSIIGTPIKVDGEMIGFYVIYQDIKERLHAEEELKNARDEAISVNKQLQQENLLRKNMQKELEDANKALIEFNMKLKEADRIKSEFISILSHDIGTPITIIQGNIEMLSMGMLGDLNEKQRTTIESMEENLNNLKKLRSDTLDLSRMDMGTLTLEKEPVLINQLIGAVVKDMKIIASKKEQSIEMEIMDIDIVRCDKDKIRQVIENYLSNAIRYGNKGGRITVSGAVKNGFLMIWVKDRGRGIPEDELDKVFESFYRTGERVNGSTGLGLSIVKGIINAHGGESWAESDGPGKGSTFFFTLPCS